ncbi:DUF3027 domain-containing protein [Nocardioides scoriae]|uniref:DUF3027 domain-containing protein n=1 Tax=Nocardioides scoriae TaxID=642780 RepID=UPI001E5A5BF3|nr:DUF3027 domain-containing protein [Nocardioides scoriae]
MIDTADPVPFEATDLARAALVEQVGQDVVGEHLGATPEDQGVVTHRFGCLQRGYRGWIWAVTVAHAAGQEQATVDEVVMLPGDEAIVAPTWVPYRDRIKPGDLSPGDLLPADEDDPRLVPTWLDGERPDPVAQAVLDEVGLGRSRVLSLEGRDLAANRWYAGEQGPDVPLAQSAPGRCGGCGFLVRLAGPMATMFGVCANEYANDDARVVALDHGCGAHSEAQLRKKQLPPPLPDPVFDTVRRDDLEQF